MTLRLFAAAACAACALLSGVAATPRVKAASTHLQGSSLKAAASTRTVDPAAGTRRVQGQPSVAPTPLSGTGTDVAATNATTPTLTPRLLPEVIYVFTLGYSNGMERTTLLADTRVLSQRYNVTFRRARTLSDAQVFSVSVYHLHHDIALSHLRAASDLGLVTVFTSFENTDIAWIVDRRRLQTLRGGGGEKPPLSIRVAAPLPSRPAATTTHAATATAEPPPLRSPVPEWRPLRVSAALTAARRTRSPLRGLHNKPSRPPARTRRQRAPKAGRLRTRRWPYAEHQSHYLGETDVSTGFPFVVTPPADSRRGNTSAYVRHPNWLLRIPVHGGQCRLPPGWAASTPPAEVQAWLARRVGTSYISRHAPFPRGELVAAFSNSSVVDVLGPLSAPSLSFHNTKWPVDAGGVPLPKRAVIGTARFAIVPENSLGEGYVTEKVIEAHMAGVVPVYWGSALPPEPSILNPARILLFDPKRPHDVVEAARRLVTDAGARTAFFAQPIAAPGGEAALQRMCDEWADAFVAAWRRRRGGVEKRRR